MRRLGKIGLALGGGGARGLAHIGVMKVLERERIRPDLIVGTSAGAIVGAALASGMMTLELEERVASFLESDLYRSSELKALGDAESGAEQSLSKRIQCYFRTRLRLAHAMYRRSLLQTRGIEELINYFVPDIQIEETAIPFRAVAADLLTGELVVLSKGPLRRSALASSAVPGVLPPVEINGRQLSDGGIISQVPVDSALREGARVVIAVAVDREVSIVSGLHTAVDVYVRAGDIRGFHLEQYDLEKAHLVIKPDLGGTVWTDFSQCTQLIARGEAAAVDALPQIRRLVKPKREFMARIIRGMRRMFFSQAPGNG